MEPAMQALVRLKKKYCITDEEQVPLPHTPIVNIVWDAALGCYLVSLRNRVEAYSREWVFQEVYFGGKTFVSSPYLIHEDDYYVVLPSGGCNQLFAMGRDGTLLGHQEFDFQLGAVRRLSATTILASCYTSDETRFLVVIDRNLQVCERICLTPSIPVLGLQSVIPCAVKNEDSVLLLDNTDEGRQTVAEYSRTRKTVLRTTAIPRVYNVISSMLLYGNKLLLGGKGCLLALDENGECIFKKHFPGYFFSILTLLTVDEKPWFFAISRVDDQVVLRWKLSPL